MVLREILVQVVIEVLMDVLVFQVILVKRVWLDQLASKDLKVSLDHQVHQVLAVVLLDSL